MRFELKDAGDLKAVNRALRQAADGKQLRRELTSELRGVVRPIVARVRAAWRSAPSQGHATGSRGRRGQPGLRALLAKATRSQVRLSGKEAGVRVRTDGRKMPEGMKALPTYAEGTKPRWRHPAYGDRDAWVAQRPFPEFYAAARPDEAQARRQVEQAVESMFKRIARAR